MQTDRHHKIDFQEYGGKPDGVNGVAGSAHPVVMFVPGSYSTPAAWRGIQKRLPPQYRMVGTSLCGYGATTDSRSVGDLDIDHEVRVLEHVAARMGNGPLHLVGHSFGGTVALAAALSRTVEVSSLALFEANPVTMIRAVGNIDLFEETRRMSQDFEAAHRAGEPDAASRIIDFWGGTDSFAAMPLSVQDYCRSTTDANVLDWRTVMTLDAGPADYARLAMPVLLVRGGLANPAMVAITDALATSLPNVTTAVVANAGHFLITSHAAECADLLRDFLAHASL
ncbi:pimeloyl-ACP methyl ester carboxylesterase [Acidovorax sp. 69]|uniref:alpha/beta fold hydrolase n=1 Tax=Acidovorax sp. 69 TaxID=2035202 RepID=UPI000C2492AC|nr:alpha/beta hydrolase [Acidovorax sp. 69]PJI97877.1 pimeloyl-ACP methyl ester carboxylesterase [Acidovorax sp. 69]